LRARRHRLAIRAAVAELPSAIIIKLLAKSAEERYQTASSLASTLSVPPQKLFRDHPLQRENASREFRL